jgi:hypothetical protein
MANFGDTYTGIANFSNVIDIVNQVAEVLELEYAVMGNLVTRREIPRGQNVVRIPYQTARFEAQDHTDGDEIPAGQAVGINTLDLTVNELQITFRITPRGLRQPAVDLAAMAGDMKAKAQAEALEVRLLAITDDSGSQDLGLSNGTDSNIAHIKTMRRMLRNIAHLSGGPAKPPIYCVINPIQEEDLLTDLGVVAASTSSTNTQSRVIPAVLEPLISISPGLEDSFFGEILRVPIFVSGYIGTTIGSVTSPDNGAFFAKKALILGVAAEWDTKGFEEASWPGIIVRSMTDYGARLGPYPSQCIQYDSTIA